MKFLIALYLLTITTSLSVPVEHAKCNEECRALELAAEAEITSNYRDEHKRRFPGVTRAEQIKRDRERLAILYTEQAAIERMIARAKKGKL